MLINVIEAYQKRFGAVNAVFHQGENGLKGKFVYAVEALVSGYLGDFKDVWVVTRTARLQKHSKTQFYRRISVNGVLLWCMVTKESQRVATRKPRYADRNS